MICVGKSDWHLFSGCYNSSYDYVFRSKTRYTHFEISEKNTFFVLIYIYIYNIMSTC